MSQRNRRAVRLLMFGGLLLTVISFADTARADLVLVVTDPAHNGLTASNMNTIVFSPATSGNPTRVMLGGLRGNMHQIDDQLVISLEADESPVGVDAADRSDPSGALGRTAGGDLRPRPGGLGGGDEPENAGGTLKLLKV